MIENKDDAEKQSPKKKHVLTGKKMNMKQFMAMKHTDISHLLDEKMKLALGEIEDGFDIVIFGGTGSGKSSFSAAVVKQLSPLGRILHLILEEGHSKSVKMNVMRSEIQDLPGYELLDGCTYEDLIYLLNRPKSAKIIIIDSIQYARFTKEQWLDIKKRFVKGKKKKIFVVISHAEGRNPRGGVATDALYDAQIKVFVKGRIAFIKSRYEGKQNYVVHEAGAKAFWGKQYKAMLTKQIF